MPQISVIVNIRNGAAFLREALDSVLAQSFADWELIAWDDCSTDESAAIVCSYRDPRIRYYLVAGRHAAGQSAGPRDAAGQRRVAGVSRSG